MCYHISFWLEYIQDIEGEDTVLANHMASRTIPVGEAPLGP